jgi:predicted transposase YdaD
MRKPKKEGSPLHIHDIGYKNLFSVNALFRQLIEGYIEGDWKSLLNFEKALKIETEFILPDFAKKDADVVYRVPLKYEEKALYLCVLIENQSTVDPIMAFRILLYVASIWNDFYKNSDEKERLRKSYRFPPVLPIVVYNGERKWTAATELKELVSAGEVFKEWIPNVRYHFINAGGMKEEELDKRNNGLSAVFLMEKPIESYKELEDRLEKVREYLKNDPNQEVLEAVLKWLFWNFGEEISNEKLDDIAQEWENTHLKQKEIDTMLKTNIQKYKQGIKQEGIKEGELKGLRLGIIQVLEGRHLGEISRGLTQKLENLRDERLLKELFSVALAVKTLEDFEKKLLR